MTSITNEDLQIASFGGGGGIRPWGLWGDSITANVEVPEYERGPVIAGRWSSNQECEKADVLDLTDTYMGPVHNPEILLRRAKEHIGHIDFDTMVGTGLSGTIAVTELARKLGKHYMVVRKPNDGTHSSLPVEGKVGKRWVFVDDLVGTGRTLSRVFDAMSALTQGRGFATTFVGTFLYADEYDGPQFVKADSHRHHNWLQYSEYYQGQYEDPNQPKPTWY
ncbi:phosphoribosyl transferase [Mycobacterium phage MyraDee]|uniref:Phosphoribosyl transferase n=1 Tax=Mycobacterium phage MyraDee TaxID=2024303 RepID=A0A222YXZ4_9CAUD|nr:phosphoribosyl transferase [Mycobacterium phage MyraDee]ASR77172.1 phosphoribosyl transferase [Mycobacterium phage MyraDee]